MIAVAGRPIAEADAYAAAGIAERDPALLSALRAAHMIRSTRGDVRELETYHDRVRQAVVASLAAAAHRHASPLAETLDAKGTVDPEWLAAHYQGAGDRHARPCTTRARPRSPPRLLAFDRAADLYQRALGLNVDTGGAGGSPCWSAGPTRWPTPAAASWLPRPISRPPRWPRPTRRWSSSERRAISTASAGTSTRAARCWPTA